MTDDECPFCRRDPYHYVDIGVGWEPVAIVCCDENIAAHGGDQRMRRLGGLLASSDHRQRKRGTRLLAQERAKEAA